MKTMRRRKSREGRGNKARMGMMDSGKGKRKRRIRLRVIAAAITIASVICGCGSSKSAYSEMEAAAETVYESSMSYDTASYDSGVVLSNGQSSEEAYEYDMAEGAAAAEEYAQEDGGQDAAIAAETSRKLIRTVNISAETENFDALMPSLRKQVETLGGYIENISVYDMNSYYVGEEQVKQRGANLTARVPKEKLDGFLTQVGEQTNVTSRSESVEDVTLQYVDLESHKKALLTEQDRLLELMEKAETVEDIIAIEGRLSEVRYQLESMESQLRTYDNQIDYSTVYLSIQEVRKYSPPQTATVWQRIKSGFMKSLDDIGLGLRDFAIGFVIDIPYIVLWLVGIAVAVLAWRILRKVWKKCRAKRAAARGENGSAREPRTGKVRFRCPVMIRREGAEDEADGNPRAGQETKTGQETEPEK